MEKARHYFSDAPFLYLHARFVKEFFVKEFLATSRFANAASALGELKAALGKRPALAGEDGCFAGAVSSAC